MHQKNSIKRIVALILCTVCTFGIIATGAGAEIQIEFSATPQLSMDAYKGTEAIYNNYYGTFVGGASAANYNYVKDGDYVWPLPTSYVTISSLTGGRRDPIYGTPAVHNGIDIPCPIGTPVVAAREGDVIVALDNRNSDGWNSGRGYYVQIRHSDGSSLIYQHLNSKSVSVGTHVEQGQLIGYSGTTGHSTGGHLHFELWLGSNMSTIGDPIKLYPSLKLYYGGVQINP